MTPRFVTPLLFQDDGGLPFTLYKDLVYVTEVVGVGKQALVNTMPAMIVRVKKGFKTDLASIPRVLWRVLPPVGKYDAAAVVHDWLYQNNGCTRKQADDVLYEAMHALGVSAWQRYTIYAGVRVGGWKPWNEYRARG